MLYITGVYAVGPDIASALQVPVRLCVNKCLALCSVSSAMNAVLDDFSMYFGMYIYSMWLFSHGTICDGHWIVITKYVSFKKCLPLDRIHVYVLGYRKFSAGYVFSNTKWEWSLVGVVFVCTLLWTRAWSRMEDFIWRGFGSVCCSRVWGCLAGVHHHRGVYSSVTSACPSCVDHTYFYPHLHREGGVSSYG